MNGTRAAAVAALLALYPLIRIAFFASDALPAPATRGADAMTMLLEQVSLAPEDASARLALARAYDGADQWSEAERQYREALRADAERMDAWQDLTRLYERGGRPDLAASAWELAATQLRDARHLEEARVAARSARDRSLATAHLREVEGGTRWQAAGELERGRSLAASGDLDRAAAAFAAALAVDPTLAEAASRLGVVRSAVGDRAGAAEAFRRVLALRPADEEAALELAWILATASEDALRDGRRAVELAEPVALHGRREDPAALDTLAAAYAATGDFALAAATARRAVEIGKRFGDQDWLAGARLRMELYENGHTFVVRSR